jgi:hypothetical protein
MWGRIGERFRRGLYSGVGIGARLFGWSFLDFGVVFGRGVWVARAMMMVMMRARGPKKTKTTILGETIQ